MYRFLLTQLWLHPGGNTMPIRMPFISNLNYYTKTCVFKELTF